MGNTFDRGLPLTDFGATFLSPPRLEERWPCFGIPDCAVVDNGKDLLAASVSAACYAMATELMFTPPYEPWYKGTIESWGRTTNIKLIHWLPGSTYAGQLRSFNYDPKKEACLTLEDLDSLVLYYIVEIHNHTPRKRKSGIPLQRWLDGVAEFPVRLPESREAFDVAVALTRSAKVDQKGVTYENLNYNSADLADIWNRLPEGKRSVQIKINPLDLTRIFVIDPKNNEPVEVPCTTEFDYPPLLDWHKVVVDETKKRDMDPANARHRADSEANLRRMVGEAIERNDKKAIPSKVRSSLYVAEKHAEKSGLAYPTSSRRAQMEELDSVMKESLEV